MLGMISILATAAVGGLLCCAEARRLRVRTGRCYGVAECATNVAMAIGNLVAKSWFGGVAAVAFASAFGSRLFSITLSWPVILVCFVLQELAYYWSHRLAHTIRLGWASHSVHHSSPTFNLTTSIRQPWTSVFSLNFAVHLLLCLIGFPPELVLLLLDISLFYQFWIHTEVIGSLGPLDWFFNTPANHRVHHATNEAYLDKNFGGILMIWDHVFRTYEPERAANPPRYGITHPVGSRNPAIVAFCEWGRMALDVRRARSVSDVIGYCFAKPGWQPRRVIESDLDPESVTESPRLGQ